MIRALLDDLKNQTRRVMNPQPVARPPMAGINMPLQWKNFSWFDGASMPDVASAYGVAGDRLWFKENYTVLRFEKVRGTFYKRQVFYRLVGFYAADNKLFSIQLDHRESKLFAKRKRKLGGQSGRFMYRSLSRIIRELTGVRSERLQDISREDAISEGIAWCDYQNTIGDKCERCGARLFSYDREPPWHSPIVEYQLLFDSLHGKGAWQCNPFVWVLTFKNNVGVGAHLSKSYEEHKHPVG